MWKRNLLVLKIQDKSNLQKLEVAGDNSKPGIMTKIKNHKWGKTFHKNELFRRLVRWFIASIV